MTQGQLEAEISREIIRFEKEVLGRGPTEVRTRIFEDIVFVRLKGVLTPAEHTLGKLEEGSTLLKELRFRLIQVSRPVLESTLQKLTGLRVQSLYTDVNLDTGERIIVFVLNDHLEQQLRQKKK
jgi:uncharacterized protein YbcI